MRNDDSVAHDYRKERVAIPDWEKVESLVIVYPQKLYRRGHLTKFYDRLINLLPVDLRIDVIVKDKEVERHLNTLFPDRNLGIFIVEDVSDIWIKDYAPLCIRHRGLRQSAKFLYDPRYFKEKEKKYAQADNITGNKVAKLLNADTFIDADIIWDLGNLTHNGNGTAIISNRLISDNESMSIDDLKRLLHVFCGFNNIVFIPVEPGDETGHVDGMVRFLDEKTVVVGKYPEHYKYASFMNILAKDLHKQLGTEYNIIRLLNAEPEDEVTEGIASAVGNHVNFLRLQNQLFFPYYGDSSDTALNDFISELRRLKLEIEVLPVDIPELKDLAKLGGVLNCMTWQLLT